jgi:hypothetical protein
MQPFETQVVFEDTGIFLFGRGKSPGGGYFQQADFDTILLKVWDEADPATVVATATLAISTTIFNSLQANDSRWTKDTTGYNFRYGTLASQLPKGGRKYRFEFKFTPTVASGYQPFFGVFRVPTLGLFTS